MVLVGGYIVDRIGTRNAIFIFGILCVIGSVVTVLAGKLAGSSRYPFRTPALVQLAAYLPWIVVRDPASVTRGTLLGWAVDALLAAAAFVIGYGAAGLGAPAVGPAEAQAAGVALVALSVGPLVFGRDVFRLGSGAVLLVVGALLIRVALAGTPTALEELVTAVLLVGLCGAVAFLAAGALASSVDEGLALSPDATDAEPDVEARRSEASVETQPLQG